MKKMKLRVTCFVMGMFVIFGTMNLTSYAQPETDGVVPAQDAGYQKGTVEEAIYNGLMNMEMSIDVAEYNLSDYDITDIYQQVIMTSPELFHVSFADMGTTGQTEGDEDAEEQAYIVRLIHPEYILAATDPDEMKTEYDEMKADMDAVAEKAFAGIVDTMSDFEKSLYLHDYILENSEYDWYNWNYGEIPTISYTAYGCLVNEITATHGYALAYKYLMDKAGVECEVITGLNTAWNAVKLNGEYYFVDLHWDNPIKYYKGSTFDQVGHKFFLLTAEELLARETGEHDWWAQDIVPTDTTYSDAPFRKVTSPFSYYNGEWYYWYNVDDDEKQPVIAKAAHPDEEGTPIYSLADYKWYTVGDSGKVWRGYQGNVDVDVEKGMLYFCSATQIFRLDLKDPSAKPQVIFTADTSYEYVYGLTLQEDYLVLGMAETPYQWEWLSYINLDWLENEVKIGDVSGDEKVDANDALSVLKQIAGITTSDYINLVADCNEDGIVDAKDALWILKKVANFW